MLLLPLLESGRARQIRLEGGEFYVAQMIARIHYPGSVRELLTILSAGRGRVAPVGGGVSFSFSAPPGVSELASLRSLGLDGIRLDSQGLRLGALVTMEQLARSPQAATFRNGLFSRAAAVVAATTNRNLITLGGNAVRLFIWSDLPVVYCAADATFIVRGPRGIKRLSCGKFYETQPLSMLSPDQFLEEIVIPPAPKRSGAAHEKFSETANTFAIVSAAACVSLDGAGRCSSARLVLGGLQLLPSVSEAARRVLEGQAPTAQRIEEAAGAAVGSARIVKDMRVSGDYKKELATAIARRVLRGAFSMAGGTQ